MKKFYYVFSFLLVFLFIPTNSPSQGSGSDEFKTQALEAFGKEDYKRAVNILYDAIQNGFEDAEIYYYLGYFTHYMAYDSRPLVTQNHIETSDDVVKYLEKALSIDPDFRDAYSLMAAEYGARGLFALYQQDMDGFIQAFKSGYDTGAFPDWHIEYGRNLLKSCEKNTILFVGGDFEYNAIIYLQAVENYRTDVTTIPLGYLDRSWYLKRLKLGFKPVIREVLISMSVFDIEELRNYKWDTLEIEIPVNKTLAEEYGLEADYAMKWSLASDLTSERRTYLSPRRALLADIIITNNWERPIHFSQGCSPYFLAGLDNFFQLYGLTSKLLPFETEGSCYAINQEVVSDIMLKPDNFQHFTTLETTNIPRNSYMLGSYYYILYRLAEHYHETKQADKVNEIIYFIETNLSTSILDYRGHVDFIKSVTAN